MEMSWWSGKGADDVQVRPEVEQATQLVIDGASPKAVLAAFGGVNAEGDAPPPAFALAQILSARAVKLLRDDIVPNHQMAHELAAQARQKMAMGQAVPVSEIADEMAWPQLARLQFKRLTDALRLSRMACELQVAGYGEAIGDRQWLDNYLDAGPGDMMKTETQRLVCDSVFGGKYASGAKHAFNTQASNLMSSAEESTDGDITDPMFALVLLQNYELQVPSMSSVKR
jgi:hypothetical protein